MVICNICRENILFIDEMQPSFRYVCKQCWRKMKIIIEEKEVDKDLLY
jgi:hypothetical protein